METPLREQRVNEDYVLRLYYQKALGLTVIATYSPDGVDTLDVYKAQLEVEIHARDTKSINEEEVIDKVFSGLIEHLSPDLDAYYFERMTLGLAETGKIQ